MLQTGILTLNFEILWSLHLYHIVSFGKKFENLLKAIQTNTVGSSLATFQSNIQKGATVFLHCKSKVWAVGKITGDYYYSEEVIWRDKVYPHRYNFQFEKIFESPVTLNDGDINALFRKSYGSAWAYQFLFTPRAVPKNIAEKILSKCDDATATTLEHLELALKLTAKKN